MATPHTILDHAIEVLRRRSTLTISAVAKESNLTKPGVIHHFPNKEALVFALVNKVTDRWMLELRKRNGKANTAVDRLRAYVDYAFTGSFDASDLSFLADEQLSATLRAQWNRQLDPWIGASLGGDPKQIGLLRAARLLADGAWLNASLGIHTMTGQERAEVRLLALELINTAGDD